LGSLVWNGGGRRGGFGSAQHIAQIGQVRRPLDAEIEHLIVGNEKRPAIVRRAAYSSTQNDVIVFKAKKGVDIHFRPILKNHNDAILDFLRNNLEHVDPFLIRHFGTRRWDLKAL
jgi:hypothetical protein